MANFFQIDKTEGSGNTTVLVTATGDNRSTSNYEGVVDVTKNELKKSVTVRQYYRPIVGWKNYDEGDIPNIPSSGGTLNLEISSPYAFWIEKCPSNVEGISVGKQYSAGEHNIAVRIGQNTSYTTITGTVQIAFNRNDGKKSTETTDGINGFLVKYKQVGVTVRNMMVSPGEIVSSADGGTYMAVLHLVGRRENEQITITKNEAYDYVTLSKFEWRSNVSEYADLEFAFEENETTSKLEGCHYTFETTDGISRRILLSQSELPFIVKQTYDGDDRPVGNNLSPDGGSFYAVASGTVLTATVDVDFVYDIQVEANIVYFNVEPYTGAGIRPFNLILNNGNDELIVRYIQENTQATVVNVYENGQGCTKVDGRPVISRNGTEFEMEIVAEVPEGTLDFDVETDDEYPFRGYDYDTSTQRYQIFITMNESGNDRILHTRIMTEEGELLLDDYQLLQEG